MDNRGYVYLRNRGQLPLQMATVRHGHRNNPKNAIRLKHSLRLVLPNHNNANRPNNSVRNLHPNDDPMPEKIERIRDAGLRAAEYFLCGCA